MMIRYAKTSDLPVLADLALKLWPDHTAQEMQEELSQILCKADSVFCIAWDGEMPVGFAQCQLRRDYVEGTESSPVGYLEGIFVDAAFRRRGVARQLLAACEVWAKDMGCREFASDCELHNTESYLFHRSVGFSEANRIICFTKQL